jgi:hypothetical protein
MTETTGPVDKNARIACEGAVKALISAVPYLRGSLSSILGDFQNRRKEKRVLEFPEGMKTDFAGLEDNINQDFVSKEDFIDIFEETAQKLPKEEINFIINYL